MRENELFVVTGIVGKPGDRSYQSAVYRSIRRDGNLVSAERVWDRYSIVPGREMFNLDQIQTRAVSEQFLDSLRFGT